MKQRRKAILALLLSASVAASPIVSATSVFAEDLDVPVLSFLHIC